MSITAPPGNPNNVSTPSCFSIVIKIWAPVISMVFISGGNFSKKNRYRLRGW
jgi:hypothetical protein